MNIFRDSHVPGISRYHCALDRGRDARDVLYKDNGSTDTGRTEVHTTRLGELARVGVLNVFHPQRAPCPWHLSARTQARAHVASGQTSRMGKAAREVSPLLVEGDAPRRPWMNAVAAVVAGHSLRDSYASQHHPETT